MVYGLWFMVYDQRFGGRVIRVEELSVGYRVPSSGSRICQSYIYVE